VSRRKRLTIWTVLLILVLIGCVGYSYDRFAAAKARAVETARDTQACRRLRQRIERLRQRPQMAEAKALDRPKLTSRIQQTAREAGIGPGKRGNLVRIDPSARGRRLGETVYTEKPVHVTLERVTLDQLMQMLGPLTKRRGMRCQHINLTPPSASKRGRRWNAELTLNYLVYAPSSDQPGG